MSDVILKLDDITAQSVLSVIARSSTAMVPRNVDWTADLRQALASEFDSSPTTTTVTDGELARQALLVLAEDPDTRNAIETMATQPQSLQKFDFGASIALTSAALIVLQTRVKFERGANGKWNLQIEKKPTSDALLKGLVQRLLSYAR